MVPTDPKPPAPPAQDPEEQAWLEGRAYRARKLAAVKEAERAKRQAPKPPPTPSDGGGGAPSDVNAPLIDTAPAVKPVSKDARAPRVALAATAPLKPRAGGLWLQPYRAKIPGSDEAAKVAAFFARVDALFALFPVLRLLVVGVLPHGFSSEFTPAKFELWRAAAAQRGMRAGAAFGLGSTTDMGAVGTRIGLVAASPGCDLVQLDAEGAAWEKPDAPAAATLLCTSILAKAPRAMLANQSWPVPTYHSNYPFEVFNKYCFCFSEQRYYNDWSGLDRYRENEAWFNESWGTEERTELAPNTARVLPHCPTIQGYSWDDIVPSLVTCLAKYDQTPLSVWCEWWPTDSFWRGARCAAELHTEGYVGDTAVWEFQAASADLAIDGICGPRTQAALGVTG